MVAVVALDHLFQPSPSLRDRFVHPSSQLLLQLAELRPHSLLHRLPPHLKMAPRVFPAIAGEPEKLEGLQLPRSRLLPFRPGPSPKLNQPRLFWMHLQPELRQSLPELLLES